MPSADSSALRFPELLHAAIVRELSANSQVSAEITLPRVAVQNALTNLLRSIERAEPKPSAALRTALDKLQMLADESQRRTIAKQEIEQILKDVRAGGMTSYRGDDVVAIFVALQGQPLS